MSIIGQGRSAGGFAVIQNSIMDGLLQHGGVDLAGFYLALKRFIDRRRDIASCQTMDWSIKYFCRKFAMGQQRFYRLAERLWQLGLLDVEKCFTRDGWQNRYLVHDYPPYQGPLLPLRQGSFKYSKTEEATREEENKPGEETVPLDITFRQETCAKEVCIGEDKGNRKGISESGIPDLGIPDTDTLIKDKSKENDKVNKNKESVSQSVYQEADVLRKRGLTGRQAEGSIDFRNMDGVLKYYCTSAGATERQVRMAMLSVQAQLDRGVIIQDTKAYFEKCLRQLVHEEEFRMHFL